MLRRLTFLSVLVLVVLMWGSIAEGGGVSWPKFVWKVLKKNSGVEITTVHYHLL